MRRLQFLLLLLALALPAWPQMDTHVVDSLLDVLPSQKENDRVSTMVELTWEFYDISFDDCTAWGEKAIDEAIALADTNLMAKAHYALGMQYCFHGDMDLAKNLLWQAGKLYSKLDDLEHLFDTQWGIARYEQSRGSIDSSLVYYQDALQTAKLMNDNTACYDVINNIAIIRYQKGELSQAKADYLQLRDLLIKNDNPEYLPRTNLNIATIDMELGNAHAARNSFYALIPIFEESSDHANATLAYLNLGLLYLRDIINYDSALLCLDKALHHSEFADSKEHTTQVYNELGNAHFQLGNNKESIHYYEQALTIANEINYQYGKLTAYGGLGQVYCRLGQAQKSLDCFMECFNIEKKMGSDKYRNALSSDLLMDYARLGKYDDLRSELNEMAEERNSLSHENATLSEHCQLLQAQADNLMAANQKQMTQIDTLTASANHYRLAFFGVLGLAIVALIAVTLCKPKR